MTSFIQTHGSLMPQELDEFLTPYLQPDVTIYTVHTDRFYCGIQLQQDHPRLLEMRLFTPTRELKIDRLDIASPFRWRYINDDDFQARLQQEPNPFFRSFQNHVYDEMQYLDIDTTRSDGLRYTTTGGGSYTLPIEKAEKVQIRNYLAYDENGIVRIQDFRIVQFFAREEAAK